MLLIPSKKNITKKLEVKTLTDSKDFYIPLDAYRGVMSPLVEKGTYVKQYQLLAESQGVFASQVHAPVSGKVIDLVDFEGKSFILLENDFQYLSEDKNIPLIQELTSARFAEILLQNGIEGSGGSRFPTTLKYKGLTNPIGTLIFNGAECEPYLTSDYILMTSKAEQLLEMASFIKKVVKAKLVCFAIEKHNADLKPILEQAASKLNIEIQVKLLSNSYPQGAELQLIKSVTGKELRKGNIPSQHGIIVNNVATLYAMYQAFFEGRPCIDRVVTVSGNTSSKDGNYLVKIGTPIGHLLKESGNKYDSNNQNLVLGGAMMGKVIDSLSTPINKGSGGLLLLKKIAKNTNNCIKCGVCVDVCPQRLLPLQFVLYNQSKNLEALKEYNLLDCIECGSCAYVCPSDVPLMENIFEGKKKINSNQ